MSNLILVDEHDNEVGTAEKMVAHTRGILHRAFSIFIFRQQDNNIQVLLQKRHINKYHSGGLWTNSCCGHPEVKENIISAGERRINEELGIKVELFELGSFIYKNQFSNGLIEHELDHVLVGIYQNDAIIPNPGEVDDFKWENILEFELWLLEPTNEFTVWLQPAWHIIKNNFDKVKELLERY